MPGLSVSDLAKELDTYSTILSAQVRSINLGVLGLTWLFLLQDERLSRLSSAISERALLAIAGACIIALVFDLIQYVFAEKVVEATLREAEETGATDGYDGSSWFYRFQWWCYRAKIWLTAVAAVVFAGLVLSAISQGVIPAHFRSLLRI